MESRQRTPFKHFSLLKVGEQLRQSAVQLSGEGVQNAFDIWEMLTGTSIMYSSLLPGESDFVCSDPLSLALPRRPFRIPGCFPAGTRTCLDFVTRQHLRSCNNSKISANQHAAFAPVWILYIPARPVDFIDNRPVDWFSKLFEIFFVSAMHSHARRQALPLGGSVMIHIMYNKINRATRFSL